MRWYRGIYFFKEELEKITGSKSLNDFNVKLAIRIVERLYEKGFSLGEIEKLFEISHEQIKKIVKKKQKQAKTSDEEVKHMSLATSFKRRIGMTTYNKLAAYYKSSPKDIEFLLKKIYKLWHKLGSFQALSIKLKISATKASQIIYFSKEKKIIKSFQAPKRPLTEKQRAQIIKIKRLYDTSNSLTEVGKQLGLTRERIRQILERGNNYGIIEYKPPVLKGFDDLVKKLKKEEITKQFIKYGSKKRLLNSMKNKYKISQQYLDALIKLYDIDIEYLTLLYKKNRCFSEYKEMVQEIGFHPTTTIMARRSKWRSLWARIGRLWGDVDAFRKEFGIPIPIKGNPNFREDMRRGREKRKNEDMNELLQFIEDNSPVSRKQIQISLNWKTGKTEKYTNEIVEKDKIDWMFDGKKYLYFKKS